MSIYLLTIKIAKLVPLKIIIYYLLLHHTFSREINLTCIFITLLIEKKKSSWSTDEQKTLEEFQALKQ